MYPETENNGREGEGKRQGRILEQGRHEHPSGSKGEPTEMSQSESWEDQIKGCPI